MHLDIDDRIHVMVDVYINIVLMIQYDVQQKYELNRLDLNRHRHRRLNSRLGRVRDKGSVRRSILIKEFVIELQSQDSIRASPSSG